MLMLVAVFHMLEILKQIDCVEHFRLHRHM